MNSKEIFSGCLKGLEIPRFPAVVIDAGTWILAKNSISMDEMLGMEDCGASLVKKFDDLFDFDIVWGAPATYNYVIRALGGEVDGSVKGSAPEMVKSFLDSPDNIPDWDDEHIERMMMADDSIIRAVRQTERLSEIYSGVKPIAVNYIGPMTLSSQLVGMMDFMMMLLDEDGGAEAVLDLALKVCRTFYKIMTNAGAEICFIGDPSSSGDLVSADTFETYSLPYIKKLCADIRPFAETILLHICGNIRDRIGMLPGSGIDALSFDRLDIDYAIQESRGDFAVFGNIPPVDVLSEKSAEEVLSYCRDLVKARKKGDKFVLCPGCDIPPKTQEANIMAIRRAVAS